ncbi:hypothetical protein LXL04_034135 [Taraxacum kok-saghyz]
MAEMPWKQKGVMVALLLEAKSKSKTTSFLSLNLSSVASSRENREHLEIAAVFVTVIAITSCCNGEEEIQSEHITTSCMRKSGKVSMPRFFEPGFEGITVCGSQTNVKVNVKLPGGKDDSGSSEVRDLKAELERLESEFVKVSREYTEEERQNRVAL